MKDGGSPEPAAPTTGFQRIQTIGTAILLAAYLGDVVTDGRVSDGLAAAAARIRRGLFGSRSEHLRMGGGPVPGRPPGWERAATL